MLVSRIGGLSSLTPYDIIAIRYAVAGVIFLGVWLYHRFPLFTMQNIALTLSGGLFYTLFVFVGFTFSPVSHAAILLPGSIPFMTALFAYFLLGEVPSKHRRIGLVIIAVGISFLGFENLHLQGVTLQGDILLLLGAASWCLYSVLLKKWNVAPLKAATGLTILTALCFLPVHIVFLPKNIAQAPLKDIMLPAIYQGILVSCVQMLLYIRTISILGPSRLGMLMACVPAFASILAVPLLDEHLSYSIVIGLIFVSFGAYWGNKRVKTPRTPMPSTKSAPPSP